MKYLNQHRLAKGYQMDVIVSIANFINILYKTYQIWSIQSYEVLVKFALDRL